MFEHRGIVVTPADFNGVDWVEKMRLLQLNTLGIHSGGGVSHDVLDVLGRFGGDTFRHEAAAAGLEWEYECHAAESLLPRSLFETAPELFRLDRRFGLRRSNGNWCVSSARALELVGENCRKLAAALPSSTHRCLFWGADDPWNWCHCPECAPLAPPDQYLRSVNTLACAVRTVDPAAVVPYLGYFSLLETPRLVKPEANVILEYAPMARCYRHGIDDPGCAVNRGYWEKLLKLLEVFEPGRAHVLEYWLDSSSFSDFSKPAVKVPFAAEVVRRDLAAYHALGIRSVTSFAVYMDGEYFRNHGDRELHEYADAVNSF